MKEKIKEKRGKKEHSPQEKIKILSKRLKEIEKERDEYLAYAQRCKADFLNYKKEEGERLRDFLDYEKENWIVELLTILDYFEKAERGLSEKERDSSVLQGFLQIRKYFENFLTRQGVEEIKTEIGKKFDPKFEEVIDTKEETGKPEGTILEVIQRGYKLRNKIIRPARVIVSKRSTKDSNK